VAGASAAARGDEPPEPAAAPRWPGRIRVAQLALLALVVLATLAGMFVYLGQHAREYGKAFEWRLFWLGTPACAGNGTSVGASWVGDMLYGMRRAFIGTNGSHAARRRALP
jgi:hypothetical protein